MNKQEIAFLIWGIILGALIAKLFIPNYKILESVEPIEYNGKKYKMVKIPC